jgi:NADH dehydrogenase
MLIKKICITGGSGFVGRTIANRLSRDGYDLRILTRNREARKDKLILLPKLELVQADIHDSRQLETWFKGCDAVINLVGILNERGTSGSGFHHVHTGLTRKIIDACRSQGVKRLMQMSALNAAADAPSHYLRSKGEAEDLAHAAAGLHTTSFRPSVIFGPDDSFFNRFTSLLRLSPVLPLACPGAKFAPVYVGDVAEAFAVTLVDAAAHGKRLHLCGPKIYTLVELVRYTAACAGLKRLIVPLPDWLSRLQASMFDLAGFVFHTLHMEKPFSTDNYLSLKLDSISAVNDLTRLGITPTAIEEVVPQYLSSTLHKSRYYSYRQHSRRNS